MGSVIFWIVVLVFVVLIQVMGVLRIVALHRQVHAEFGAAQLKFGGVNLMSPRMLSPVFFLIGVAQLFPSKGLENGIRLAVAMALRKDGKISDHQLTNYIRSLEEGSRT